MLGTILADFKYYELKKNLKMLGINLKNFPKINNEDVNNKIKCKYHFLLLDKLKT